VSRCKTWVPGFPGNIQAEQIRWVDAAPVRPHHVCGLLILPNGKCIDGHSAQDATHLSQKVTHLVRNEVRTQAQCRCVIPRDCCTPSPLDGWHADCNKPKHERSEGPS
jgi:hypothetical protein